MDTTQVNNNINVDVPPVWKKCQCSLSIQDYVQLFFWFGMLMGLLVPLAVYINCYEFFDVWPVIYRFFVLLSVNGSWLMLVSPVGYFLLQAKVSNKAISAVYSICLCVAVVVALVCIAFTQAQTPVVDVTEVEDPVVSVIRDHFDETGGIPSWLELLQTREQCCGFTGPEDWTRYIYPGDKPAIEDVPESCCVTPVVGCNLVMHQFKNRSLLGRWIHTDGCRKFVERHLGNLLDQVAYGSAVLLMTGILLVAIFWCQLKDLLNAPPDEICDDGEAIDDPGVVFSTEASGIGSRNSQQLAPVIGSSRSLQGQPANGIDVNMNISSNATSMSKLRQSASTASARARQSARLLQVRLRDATASPVTDEDLLDPGDRLNIRAIRTNSRLSSRSNSRRSINKD